MKFASKIRTNQEHQRLNLKKKFNFQKFKNILMLKYTKKLRTAQAEVENY